MTVTETAAAPEATAPPAAEDPAQDDEEEEVPAAPADDAEIPVFEGALGGVDIPTVTDNGDGSFSVENNATFNSLLSALIRACDVQNNQVRPHSRGSPRNLDADFYSSSVRQLHQR